MTPLALVLLTLSGMLGAEPKYQPLPADHGGLGATIPASVVFEPNRTYSRPTPGIELKLDLARPKDKTGPFPAVVCVHGGAWISGNRKALPIILELASRGYVGITIDYRLATTAPFPACVRDVKTAVRWLRENAKAYNIDPDRIAVVGYSAGGHLAALLATTEGLTCFEAPIEGLAALVGGPGAQPPPRFPVPGTEYFTQSSSIKSAVGYYAPTDLAALYEFAMTDPKVSRAERVVAQAAFIQLLGGTPRMQPAAAAYASPVTYVTRHSKPLLLLHGTSDHLVPGDQSHRLADRYALLKADCELVWFHRAGHSIGSGIGGRAGELADACAFRFLDYHLHPGP